MCLSVVLRAVADAFLDACVVLSLARLSRLVFRVVCTVIFNYYYYHEFCFPGGVRGYFLIATTITSYVFRMVCAVNFFIITFTHFVVISGGVRGYV